MKVVATVWTKVFVFSLYRMDYTKYWENLYLKQIQFILHKKMLWKSLKQLLLNVDSLFSLDCNYKIKLNMKVKTVFWEQKIKLFITYSRRRRKLLRLNRTNSFTSKEHLKVWAAVFMSVSTSWSRANRLQNSKRPRSPDKDNRTAVKSFR